MPNRFQNWLKEKAPWLLSIIKFIVFWRLITIVPIILLSFKVYNQDNIIYEQARSEIEQNTRISNLEKENLQLKKINTQLITNVISSGRAFDKIHLPIWSKLKRGERYIAQLANIAFQDKFLAPNNVDVYEWIGNTDYDVFPFETAQLFNQGDSIVAVTGEEMMRIEKFRNIEGKMIEEEVIKWRDLVGRDTLVWGMIQRKIK